LEEVQGGYDGEGIRVRVEKSGDPRCERCWVHDPTTGADPNHPGVCRRCLDALAGLG
jgi:isoleucyl-tRNA synthetase